jgi:hypothetical protein
VINIEPGSTDVVIDCETIGLSAEGVRDRRRKGRSLRKQCPYTKDGSTCQYLDFQMQQVQVCPLG